MTRRLIVLAPVVALAGLLVAAAALGPKEGPARNVPQHVLQKKAQAGNAKSLAAWSRPAEGTTVSSGKSKSLAKARLLGPAEGPVAPAAR
jgi:hypothetical protein